METQPTDDLAMELTWQEWRARGSFQEDLAEAFLDAYVATDWLLDNTDPGEEPDPARASALLDAVRPPLPLGSFGGGAPLQVIQRRT